jgi:outer membrane lipoprotein-sorting protein
MTSEAPRQSRRPLAWAAPAAGLVIVAAAVTVPMVASASPSLPTRTAAQLLASVAQSSGTPLSGTVVETARLGIPALPQAEGAAISPTALLAGSHTAHVWYDGADKARIALVGPLAETDFVRNGRDVWIWTSGANTAQHYQLPAAKPGSAAQAPGTAESVTPQKAAAQALAAVDPTTKVTVDGTASVAGRSAYELVLVPKDTRSLVGDVRIAVDSKTGVPLRVRVYARGTHTRPAFETTFTSVSLRKPGAGVFRFSPPPGAKVTNPGTPGGAGKPDAKAGASDKNAPKVIGTGWTAVVELSGVSLPTSSPTGRDNRGSASDQLGALRKAMTPVQGAFGHGQVLRTKLLSLLLLDDGRLFVGSVTPAVLEQAAAK